jgi:multimeric flavodoxin WrbA
MQVIAINSSPNAGRGNTAVILDPFLEGMREAGAEVELLYTKKLKIKPCRGDLNCWLRTPGECSQKDDMEALLPKLRDSDVMVFATPLYVDGMSGPMKMFLDRMIPLGLPFIELRDDHCRHPARDPHLHQGKVALVSNCGFWELDNFDALVTHMEAICKNFGREFAGALLRPHGGALRAMLELGAPVQDVLDAAKDAGRQLIQDGKMRPETLATVGRELLPREVYLERANQNFQDALDEVEKRRERAQARAARKHAAALQV